MKNRFSSLQIGNRTNNKTKNLVLKNRVVVPPMASATANAGGFVTENTIEHYEQLAKSGAGLLFVEYSHVSLSGRSEPNQLAVDDDNKLPGLTSLAKAIKAKGLVAGIQLTHAGGKTSRDLTDGHMWAPSAIAVPAYKSELEVPEQMSLEMIGDLVQSFVEAAERGWKAGFNIVEIHCAHGYGINQWLSPITNQRADLYGGSLKNRARILFEIVKGIKKRVPELILVARIPGQDLLDGGLSLMEMKCVARELERLGIDLLDVSSGLGGWRRPKERRGQGYLLAEAREIQKSVDVPVIGVGGITDGVFIDELIGSGAVSLAAVGRAILKSPDEWNQNFMSDFEKEKMVRPAGLEPATLALEGRCSIQLS